LGRSRTGNRSGGRRPATPRAAPPADTPDAGGDPLASTPSLGSATLPRVFNGVGYRPLGDATRARALFDFAAIPWPESLALAWGAFVARADGERLVGAIVAERHGGAVMLHGPVVVADDGPDDPLEAAAQLVAAAMDHAGVLGGVTLYTRPQGLDRVWVRFGFIPVPEVALPPALAGRPGVGLYAWRGGSALWTLREAAEG
jgi:hypothetical protein